ncbi:MAG: hypothetical protein E7051_03140 [Lentisphaerae bacterium]|nr:hypothetical protein [Lentisphaerota bacterium]
MKKYRTVLVIFSLIYSFPVFSTARLDAKHFLKKLDDADSQYKFAICCYYGYGIEKDWQKAVYHLEKAVEKNHPQAQYFLGNCYLRGDGGRKDHVKAWKLIKLAADNNCLEAQFQLGESYRSGAMGKQDFSLAEKYLKKAAESGSEDAKILLFFRDFWDMKSGISKFKQLYKGFSENNAASQYKSAIFYLENGGEKYKNKVLEYLKKSADKNYTKAQYKLVQLYTDGTLFDKNYIEAEKYLLPLEKKRKFQKDADYAKLMLEFGVYFCRDVKNQQEFAKGVQYLKKAADKNSINALWMLVNYNLNGINMPVNYAEVFKYASILDKKGQYQAKLILATCYLGGLGVKADPQKGFSYIASVADKYPEAKLVLAECYQKGVGTPQNMKKAFDIYMESAKSGNIKALFQVGLCYENCWGVKEYSQTAADKYFKQAADKGHVEAMYRLGISKLKNYSYSYRHDSAADAFKYLQMAVENGCKKAYEKLGYCYEKGIGTAKNFETALAYYQKADKLSADALYQIGKYHQRNKNNQEYMKYLVDSADQGSKAAMEELGTNYYRGENGFEKNYLSAEKYYSALLKKAYPENMESILYNLAYCFKARGAVEEYEKTYARYRQIRSAREQKENARFKWLKEKASSYSAEDDANGNAAFELVQMYESKLTVEERCKYLEIAASKGHKKAEIKLYYFRNYLYKDYFEKKRKEEEDRKNRALAEAEREYRRQQYRQEEEARKFRDAVRFQEGVNLLLDAAEIMDFMDNTLPKVVKELKSRGY